MADYSSSFLRNLLSFKGFYKAMQSLCRDHQNLLGQSHIRNLLWISEPSSWSLTIWGKLLDGVGATQIMGPKPPSAGVLKVKPLSFYLKSLVIKPLEDTQTSSEENRVWEKSKHIGDNRDRFHVRYNSSTLS